MAYDNGPAVHCGEMIRAVCCARTEWTLLLRAVSITDLSLTATFYGCCRTAVGRSRHYAQLHTPQQINSKLYISASTSVRYLMTHLHVVAPPFEHHDATDFDFSLRVDWANTLNIFTASFLYSKVSVSTLDVELRQPHSLHFHQPRSFSPIVW